MDRADSELLAETLRKTMTAASGRVLDMALVELGWPDLLAEFPDVAIPTAFRLLGETGAHAPLLNDVLLSAAGRRLGGTLPLPYAGGSWVVWDRCDQAGTTLDADLPLRSVPASPGGEPVPLAAGRRALGWWLTGLGRAMLSLSRSHALDRIQFGRPLASFQAVRHQLAETLVALDGAEATLLAASASEGDNSLSCHDCAWRAPARSHPPAGQQRFATPTIRCRYSGQTKAGITCLRMKMAIPGCPGVTRLER